MKQKVLAAKLVLILTGFGISFLIAYNTPTVTNPEPQTPPIVITPREGKSEGVINYAGLLAERNAKQQASETTNHFKPSTTKPLRPENERYVIINNKEYPLRTYSMLLTPNDPYASQWTETNAKLTQAWDTPRGARETVLAVIDTGFSLNHEEFAGRWYINPGESGVAVSELPSALNCSDRALPLTASCNLIDDDYDGTVDNETGAVTYQNPSRLNCTAQSRALDKSCNQIDDDANGHIDDVSGWDFINNDNLAQAGELNPSGSGTQHGTMVAGVAAATGNNAKGIAGVDWGTKILPIQALDDDSYGDTLSVGRAIYYAISQNVDVISISLGSVYPDPYVQEAVQAAIAEGIVVVAASGNDGCDCMVYPANYPEVLAVGALNTLSQRASFSSYGQNLDILAPGTSVTSSTWTAINPTSAYASGLNGTSFATPMVGGLLTRMLSYQANISPLQLVAALTENTNRLTLPATTSHSSLIGFGTLDAQKATNRMNTAKNIFQEYRFYPVSKGQTLNPSAPAEVASSINAYQCEAGTVGTTPLYLLTKAGAQFFSASLSEVQQSTTQGYNAQFFAYICLEQPQDIPQSIRSINFFQEFLNTSFQKS